MDRSARPKMTVLLPTFNGARTLPRVLDSFRHLEMPDGGWVLCVVDNGSSDDTERVVKDHARSLPLRYMFESARGKNRALNRALSEVECDLVVLTDDDVLARPPWLRALRRAADDNPDFTMFAGSILPRWEVEPEPWLLEAVPLSAAYAVLDPPNDGPCDPRLVFGPNMAIRAAVFRDGLRFDESFGPTTGSYIQGGETELCSRLAACGHRAWHCTSAIVEHIIPAEHMRRGWVLERARRFGRGEFRLALRRDGETLGARLRHTGPIPWRLAIGWARLQWSGRSRDVTTRILAQWRWRFLAGQALEAVGVWSRRGGAR